MVTWDLYQLDSTSLANSYVFDGIYYLYITGIGSGCSYRS